MNELASMSDRKYERTQTYTKTSCFARQQKKEFIMLIRVYRKCSFALVRAR